MSIKMVREPSETPNITNIDDIVPFRYAYGNQNGYVKDRGSEISYSINGSQFTVNSGRLVLQGVECDISASGVTLTIDPVAELRYYVAYLQVNLALNTVTISTEHSTITYPTISSGDDLTELPTGTARLPIYEFEATSGVISNVVKLVNEIEYVDENFIKKIKVNDSSKINNLELVKDNNGILRIGDFVIPQKKLLYSDGFSLIISNPDSTTINNTAGISDSSVLSKAQEMFSLMEQGKKYTVEIGVKYNSESTVTHEIECIPMHFNSLSAIVFRGITNAYYSGDSIEYSLDINLLPTQILFTFHGRCFTKIDHNFYVHIMNLREIID